MDRTSEAREFKETVYEQFARIGKAVSSPKRLELLDLLGQGPRTVEELARGLNQSVANTSQHLQVLRAARLVASEKSGLFVKYRLADEAVGDFFRVLRKLAEDRYAQVERTLHQFLEEHGLAEEDDHEDLVGKIIAGDVTLIDLRSEQEYRLGHIPGALSIPYRDLEQHFSELPKNKEIVAYCRGPYCVIGIEAVEFLLKKGFKAVRLSDGVPEWKADGHSIETTSNNIGVD